MQHAGICGHPPAAVEHDPLSLQHRSLINDCVRAVVLQPHAEAQSVLARYGLRPSQLKAWQQAQIF